MVLVCEALGGGDAALPLVPLVEFSHNATLIHDDIEDNSEERRGKPAVHVIHGVDAAINTGSFLYFLALACIDSWAAGLESKEGLSETDAELAKAKVYGLWAGFMRKLHLGQATDIHWHRNVDLVPPVKDYYRMCGLKTGCLARFAAELGVLTTDIAAKATGNTSLLLAGMMGGAAEKLGVGFQILDDVKNVSGDGIAGKNRGDDIVEGKKKPTHSALPAPLARKERDGSSMLQGSACFRCFRAGSGRAYSGTRVLWGSCRGRVVRENLH